MILYSFPSSPFACKVRAVILACEQEVNISIENFHPWIEDPAFRALNPLGKIPVLKTDEHGAIFDSPVICEYIMDKARKLEDLMPNRIKSLKIQALVDGMADAAISMRYEYFFRPKQLQCKDWYDRQQKAIMHGLSYLECHIKNILNHALLFENLCVATFLSYLDLRFSEEAFHRNYEKLYEWYQQFLQQHTFLEKSKAKDHPIPTNITCLQK